MSDTFDAPSAAADALLAGARAALAAGDLEGAAIELAAAADVVEVATAIGAGAWARDEWGDLAWVAAAWSVDDGHVVRRVEAASAAEAVARYADADANDPDFALRPGDVVIVWRDAVDLDGEVAPVDRACFVVGADGAMRLRLEEKP